MRPQSLVWPRELFNRVLVLPHHSLFLRCLIEKALLRWGHLPPLLELLPHLLEILSLVVDPEVVALILFPSLLYVLENVH